MKMIRVVGAALAVMVFLTGCTINITNGPSTGEAADAGSGGGSAINWSKLISSADNAILQLELGGESSDVVNATLAMQDGQAVVVAADLDEGSCDIAYSQDGKELGSDVANTGVGVSESGLPAGTYDVVFSADGATGTVYVLSYPAGTLDFDDASPDSLYETVRGYVNENM